MSERASQEADASSLSPCPNKDSCTKTVCDRDRRRLLGALAAGGALSLAGCTGLFATPEVTDPETERERFDVEYTQQSQTLSVSESQTVLGAGLDEGLDLPYDCNAGFCGVCLAQANGDASQLVDMRMNDVDRLTESAVEAGYFLPCTSQPRNHFRMDTGVSPGDLDEFQEVEEEDEEDEEETEDDDEETDQPAHTVVYTNEQWSIQVPEDKDLLEAGLDLGLDLPYQCLVGTCGQCLARTDSDANEVVEMTENDYGPLDDDAIEDGYFLTCTGFARDDFDLESNVYGDLD